MKVTIRGGKSADKCTNALCYQQHFDSTTEFAEWAKEFTPKPGQHGQGYRSSRDRGPGDSWDMNAGWEKSLLMAEEGWEQGAEDMRKTLQLLDSFMPEVSHEGATNDISFAFGEEGDEPLVDAYLEGDDRPWLEPVFTDQKPIVRVGVNVGASAGVDAKAMAARGCVVAAAARKLEDLGYGVQVYIYNVNHCYTAGPKGNNWTGASVRVKDSDEFIDDRMLSFWLGHPAVLRRLMFCAIESTPLELADPGSGYGSPGQGNSDDFDFVSDEDHLNLSESEGWTSDPEKAAEAAIAMIERIMDGQVNTLNLISE